MASILRVNTLTDASSNNSTAMSVINQGVAKAWYNLSAGGASLRDSFNIGSITDQGTGLYDGNFTSAMNDGNYAAGGSCTTKGNNNSYAHSFSTGDQLSTYGVHTTAAIRTNSWAENISSLSDPDMVQVNVHGDLA